MQMKDYPRVRTYDSSDIILIDKPEGGTKSLTLGDLVSGDNNPTFQAISDAEEQLSTKRHVVGDLFIYDNKLCKAIAEIAVGNELVFGGNIEATTISDEITSINADLANKIATTPWAIMPANYFNVAYRKLNGIVHVNFDGPTKQAITKNETCNICTIPEGFRPTRAEYVMCCRTDVTVIGMAWINSAGAFTLRMNDNVPVGYYIGASLVY